MPNSGFVTFLTREAMQRFMASIACDPVMDGARLHASEARPVVVVESVTEAQAAVLASVASAEGTWIPDSRADPFGGAN